MKDFWDKRYASQQFAYGEMPNHFFKSEISKIPPGKILLPAEGEGRNGVYAATLGWEVTAFDISKEGKIKATLLASKNDVNINYLVSNLEDLGFPENEFDVIALIFAHFPADKRAIFHKKLLQYLKPGGTLILEGFNKKQLRYSSGGPKNEAMLFSQEELTADFKELNIISLEEQVETISEGPFHEGEAALIKLLARK